PIGKRTSAQMAAVKQPVRPPTLIPEAPAPDPMWAEPIYPSIKPRSAKTIFFAFMGALVLGAGGVVGFMVSRSEKPAAAIEPQEPPKQMIETAVPTEPAANDEAKPGVKEEAKAAVKEEAKAAVKEEAKPVDEPARSTVDGISGAKAPVAGTKS